MLPNNTKITEKIPLFGKTLSELQDIVKSLSLAQYTAKQIADWLYKKEVYSIDEFLNLSKKQETYYKKNTYLDYKNIYKNKNQ